jgi:hypothetical protein
MAHSNLKLKTSLTGSRTSHLDAHSFMEHAQPSYAQITVPNITHSQSSWSQSFYAQILHQFTVSSNKLLVLHQNQIPSISLGMYCLHT